MFKKLAWGYCIVSGYSMLRVFYEKQYHAWTVFKPAAPACSSVAQCQVLQRRWPGQLAWDLNTMGSWKCLLGKVTEKPSIVCHVKLGLVPWLGSKRSRIFVKLFFYAPPPPCLITKLGVCGSNECRHLRRRSALRRLEEMVLFVMRRAQQNDITTQPAESEFIKPLEYII